MSVFVTGNKIYMVGRRITSVMVAQDARNGVQSFRQVRALGGGKTLRPICGCISLMLGRVLRDGWMIGSDVGMRSSPRGCPCRPYISGEQGYKEGFLVGYG